MNKSLLPFLISALNILPALGQTTKDGTRLQWDQRIVVTEGSMAYNARTIPAHTITIFETDGGNAIDLWHLEMTPISTAIDTKPTRATGARLAQISAEPLTVLAEATTDKKANLAKLTLAFLSNDSALQQNKEKEEKYMRELALRLNKAVVQGQIDRYQKDLDKAGDKLGGAQKDKAKAENNLAKANRELEKLKSRRAKIQGENAKLQGNIAGFEKKFALTNDPKDLKRLTKTRTSLAKNETGLAKIMEREAKVQGSMNKHQGTLEKHSDKASGHQESREDLQRIISELKRKQDNIR